MEKLSMQALGRKSVNDFKSGEKMPFVFVLDNIRSGLNIGSIFRTADAFAFTKVLLCGITAQPPHREILKTALGSTDSVEWEWYENTPAAIDALKSAGYKVFAVEQTSEPIWLQDLIVGENDKIAFVLGNEVDGVDTNALALCDGAIEIPQYGTKHSLNVSVAAGIVAWEAVRLMPRPANKT